MTDSLSILEYDENINNSGALVKLLSGIHLRYEIYRARKGGLKKLIFRVNSFFEQAWQSARSCAVAKHGRMFENFLAFLLAFMWS